MPKPRLQFSISRRFIFSCGAFVVAVVAATIWLAIQSTVARRQNEIVAMVLAKGGQVHYRHQETIPRRGWDDSEPEAPEPLRRWLGDDFFQTVTAVFLFGDKFTDEDLTAIGNLKSLQLLTVNEECAITPAALRQFQAAMPQCEIATGIDF